MKFTGTVYQIFLKYWMAVRLSVYTCEASLLASIYEAKTALVFGVV